MRIKASFNLTGIGRCCPYFIYKSVNIVDEMFDRNILFSLTHKKRKMLEVTIETYRGDCF